MLTLLTVLLLQTVPPRAQGMRVPGPTEFVAFSAELKITNPKRPVAYGRFLQDEHGCTRRETVTPNGALMVQINNFQTERTYRLVGGTWTSQAMRIIPGVTRRPRQPTVDREAGTIEGFKAYISVLPVTSPRGNSTRESILIPALNFFEAVHAIPGGDTITAQNIRPGPQDHSEFLPPDGAYIVDTPGSPGFAQFSAVVVLVTFPDRAPVELTTTEQRPIDLRTPGGDTLQLVTTVENDANNLVRVRVMKNAVRKGLADVEGDLLDDVQLTLRGTARTTKLAENFEVRVTRIRDRTR